MGMKPAQVELSIDELILDARVAGARSPRALQALRAEIEAELTRLLRAGELPAQFQGNLRVETVDAGRLVRSDAHRAGAGEQLAAQIAQSIYRSLVR